MFLAAADYDHPQIVQWAIEIGGEEQPETAHSMLNHMNLPWFMRSIVCHVRLGLVSVLYVKVSLGCLPCHLHCVSCTAGGADPRHAESHALRVATRNGHVECVIKLVELGADVSALNHEALVSAAGYGHTGVSQAAAGYGHVGEIKLLDPVCHCLMCDQCRHPCPT
jgi:hypothetical protein